MLSPNPPPSVVEANGQNLPPPFSITSNATLASGLLTSAAHQNSNNISNTSNFNNASSTTPSNNVIINNIKTNTTTMGTTNPESGVVQPAESSTAAAGVDANIKTKDENNCLRNRWHTCPELHKAMDGVTYIADHTKKEEESTRVSKIVRGSRQGWTISLRSRFH